MSREITPDGQLLGFDLTRRAALAAAGGAWAVAAGMQAAAAAPAASTAKHTALIRTASDCLAVAEVCQAHCIKLLGAGDTSMKACMGLVAATLPMCEALIRLAALDAPRLAEFTKVCIGVCADCEAECRKHADHHAECRDCADACAACIKACKAVSGA